MMHSEKDSHLSVLSVAGQLISVVVVLFVVVNGFIWLFDFSPLTLAIATFSGMAAAVATATFWLRLDGKTWKGLGLDRPQASDVGTGLLVSGAIIVVYMVCLRIATAAGLPPLDISTITGSVVERKIWFVWMVLVAWGSAAFGEELIWRGFLMNRLRRIRALSRVSALRIVLIQAAIFGVMHFYQGAIGIVMSGIAGLILGIVYVRSGYRLWPAIFAHGIVDSVALSLAHFGGIEIIFGT